MSIVSSNPNIYRDTSLDYLGSSPLLDNHSFDVPLDEKVYPAGENFYNDIKIIPTDYIEKLIISSKKKWGIPLNKLTNDQIL